MALLKNKYLWIALSVIVLGAAIVYVLPKPIDMDLAKVGNGRPSVVFVYDLNLAVSNQQSIAMNQARNALGDKANFLVLKVGDPRTQAFKQRYNAQPPELLFFNGDGQLIDRKIALISPNALIEILSTP